MRLTGRGVFPGILAALAALLTGVSCSGGGGGGDGYPLQFADNFSSGLGSWSLCGNVLPTIDTGGNPGECMRFDSGIGEALYNGPFGGYYTYQWDQTVTFAANESEFKSGVTSSSGCGWPGTDTIAAGFLTPPGASWVDFLLNGQVIGGVPVDYSGGKFVRLKLYISGSAEVRYYVNGTVRQTGNGVTLPESITFQADNPGGGTGGYALVDNVTVRGP